jgi:LacI family gluconate utilization system Gnt-I transcriptional repressor
MSSRPVKLELPAGPEEPPALPGKAKLRDVARLAGVAPITVSRALRAPATVAPVTRARIMEAVAATGYVPDLVARSFKSNRSGLIAAIVPNIETSQYAEMLEGMSAELHESGYELMVGVSGLSLEHEEKLLTTFVGRRPEGVVLTGGDHTEAARALLRRAAIPVVEMGSLGERPLDMAVGYAEEKATGAMVEHLHACGYRRIGFICGPLRHNERARRRRHGYELAIRRLKLPRGLVATVPPPPRTRGGAEALASLLDAHPDMDAVLCSSDSFALGALFECQRRGIEVPGRLGIAGFLGLELAAETVPALTTVRVPIHAIGREAARLLVRRLRGEHEGPVTMDLGFEVVPRGSTRPPRASAA